MKTVRSNWSSSFNTDGDPIVINSGNTSSLWSFRFGGEGNQSGIKEPLDSLGMQSLLIEFGWESILDKTI